MAAVCSNLEPLLTEKDAARVLGWTVRALQQRRFRGKEPRYIKLDGRSVRYEPAVIREFIERGRVRVGDEAA